VIEVVRYESRLMAAEQKVLDLRSCRVLGMPGNQSNLEPVCFDILDVVRVHRITRMPLVYDTRIRELQ
jgi:hypothetical protein